MCTLTHKNYSKPNLKSIANITTLFTVTNRSANRANTFAVDEDKEEAEPDNATNNQMLRILALERETRALR